MLFIIFSSSISNASSNNKSVPALMLAEIYRSDTDLSRYYVSEKLDGIRAYWNGKRLVSRGGNIINAPDWFTQNFPDRPLDGELWAGRKKFEFTSSVVRSGLSKQQAWKKLKYMVFDMPAEETAFNLRLIKLKQLVQSIDNDYLSVIPQKIILSKVELKKRLIQVTRNGGEGLMLHKTDSQYRAKRSFDLLKLKLFNDAEAQVISYQEGKGKYKGLMGAITVINNEGVQFKIGSGFSDKERKNPPAIGSIITYRYRGKTKYNVPRFATFLRQRNPE